ncbi:hypothetical protein CGRA01v4_09760 [Colletotrichum graminicola]|uniref:Uncharacterized protein n=1 Tax=Colletotrichum graminicola (strain M1.001 / M2 / FGSC 10212) TaxID=645133 RepID=E3QTI0_COLGM|nr:uncharacterized protein GLRG_09312 [Colletotrichum graminicola M1.001]EFQ34168.1 hypothetical protein GLRG_09312 [Colletotrichum graminicola M1.001]WDK18475.1 hypothetical protein CGRA01v4_09760 [Colletotrichum graminicola]
MAANQSSGIGDISARVMGRETNLISHADMANYDSEFQTIRRRTRLTKSEYTSTPTQMKLHL